MQPIVNIPYRLKDKDRNKAETSLTQGVDSPSLFLGLWFKRSSSTLRSTLVTVDKGRCLGTVIVRRSWKTIYRGKLVFNSVWCLKKT